jgi:hypothetical protein
MRARKRMIAAGMLVLLAGAFSAGIVALHSWGGRIETLMMVFGDRVWVTLDAGRPRVLLLLAIPAVLLWAAMSLRARRPGQ